MRRGGKRNEREEMEKERRQREKKTKKDRLLTSDDTTILPEISRHNINKESCEFLLTFGGSRIQSTLVSFGIQIFDIIKKYDQNNHFTPKTPEYHDSPLLSSSLSSLLSALLSAPLSALLSPLFSPSLFLSPLLSPHFIFFSFSSCHSMSRFAIAYLLFFQQHISICVTAILTVPHFRLLARLTSHSALSAMI